MEIPKPDFTPTEITNGTRAFWEYRNGSNDIIRITATFVGNALRVKNKSDQNEKDDFYKQLDLDVSKHPGLSSNRVILTEMLLSRVTDNFLTYLSDLLSFIFSERPEMVLSEKGSIDIKRLFESENIEELRSQVIEERVNQLSYKSVSDLADYLKEKLGFSVFDDKTEKGIVVKTIEARNIIVHNRCKINARYNIRTGFPNEPVGERLEIYFSDIIRMNGYFDELAQKIDFKAVEKFSLATVANPHAISKTA